MVFLAMKKIKVAINGFGRIGRTLARTILNHPQIEVIAINELADVKSIIHLWRYDSVHGRLNGEFHQTENGFTYNGSKVDVFNQMNPEFLPWGELNVDVVVEATGHFKDYNLASKHITAGAKRVIISAPPIDDSVKTIVIGINDEILNGQDLIVSNASCTTNSAAPLIKLIHENFELESAYITTVHSFTTDQKLHDSYHKDLRRARAATQSIVPTTTGAAKALTKIFPDLDGFIGGCGIRVPVPDGSLTDLSCVVKKNTNIQEINYLFEKAAQTELKGILEYTEDPIVSVDVIGNTHSCIFDAGLTSVIGKMVKVVGWYDNEVGYSNRIKDLILKIA